MKASKVSRNSNTVTSSLRHILQADYHLHVVDGEETSLRHKNIHNIHKYQRSKHFWATVDTYYSVERALEPVIVDAFGQVDDVTFLESQLTLVLGLEVVESLTARLRAATAATWWSTGERE